MARDRHDVIRALSAAGDLLDRTAAPFCAQPMWLAAWYARSRARPLAVIAEYGGTTVGLACLAIHQTGPLRTITLAGDGPSDYGRLPVKDESVAAALADGMLAVLAHIHGPWRLRLAQLPSADPVARALLEALPGARLTPGQGCPAMTFGPDRRLEALISAKARRAARRGWARLDHAGVRVRVDRIREPARISNLLPEIVALHRARDHALGRRSDLDQSSRRAFYADMVQGLCEAGRLDVWVLRLDDALGAFVIGVQDRTSYRTMDARIGDLWPSTSPGQLLRTEMITALLADPTLTELDWMRGESRNKMQHATHVVPTEHLLAESSAVVTTALRRWNAFRGELRERIPTEARMWIRSRTTATNGPATGPVTTGPAINAPARRFRAGRAARDAGQAAPRQPGAADGNREPS